MAVRQTRAGTWEVDHYFFDTEGRRRRKLRTFAKHKDAVAYEKEALAQVQKGEFVAPSKVTVEERARDWLQTRFANGNYERSTRIERENHVHRYIVPAFGAMPIQNLNVQRIEKQATEWNQRVDAMVVNRALRTLTDIMGEAKRHGIIKDNPAAEAKRLKEETKAVTSDQVFTRDELRAVIEATEPESRERIMVMLPALTGCRVGELLAATWEALDLKAAKFDIRLTMADSDRGEEMTFKEPKTQNSRRTVPLAKELIRELRLWRMKCPPSERGLVIVSDRGKPVNRRVVSVLVKRIIGDLGIKKDLTPHSLRHTFASLLLADRVPITEVSHLLGHKNSAITLKTYAHFMGEETDSVHNLSASIFGGDVSTDVSITSRNVS